MDLFVLGLVLILVFRFSLSLDPDTLDGVSFALVDDIGIYLGRAYIRVGEQVGNCVDIRTFVHLQGGESMAEAVESDVLSDAGRLKPVLKRSMRMVALEVLEHESGGTSPAEFVSFVGQRQGRLRIRLLGPNPDAPASVLRFFNVTPIECQYITDTQARKTTEKGCLF